MAKPEQRVFKSSRSEISSSRASQGPSSRKSWSSWRALSWSIAFVTAGAALASQTQAPANVRQARRYNCLTRGTTGAGSKRRRSP